MTDDGFTLPVPYNLAVDFVDRHLAEGRGGKVAIRTEGRALTYAEVAALVNRVASGLRSLGIEEEQRTLLLLPDSPEFAAAYFGTIKMGGVAIPTNTALRGPDYAYFLDESRARVLFVHSSLWPEVEPVLRGRPYLKHVIVTGEARPGAMFWDTWLKDQPEEAEAADTHPDDVAFWLWTSGSTGQPKGAVHLHQDWTWCCRNYARGVLDIAESDVTFSSSKLFHAYGLGNALLFPFSAGATTVLHPGKPRPADLLRIAQAEKPSIFYSVPTLYAMMLQETEDENPYDLSSVRIGVSAAEPLAADIFRRWKDRFGFEVLDGIGSTEVLHIYVSPRAGEVKPGSTGKPVPGYEVKITDEHGEALGTGEVGDLWVRGPSSAPYYWKRRALTRDRMRGEWFFTGDKYYVDDDGYLWYAGRSDDMFRTSGQWVSPNEVESTLIEHPAVLEAAVVPFVTDERLTKPEAYVIVAKGHEASDDLAAELQTFVKEKITPYKYPRRIHFVESLPKTAAGKIQRFKLRGDAGAEG